MASPPQTARLLGPLRRLRNRWWVWRAGRGATAAPTAKLPEPWSLGEADCGASLVAGVWTAMGRDIDLAGQTIWQAPLPDPRLGNLRETFDWLDDLGALGTRSARSLAQTWTYDWIRQPVTAVPGRWRPETAGRRAMRWVAHARLLTEGQDPAAIAAYWAALARHQRYLARAWDQAAPGLAQLRALAGLVWTGRVLPWAGHAASVAALGARAAALVGPDGDVPSRRPEDLADVLSLLVWTARLLEDGGEAADPAHLSAIVRIVPVLRLLRLGGGVLPRFHGGGAGDPAAMDKALAELRLDALPRARNPMGYVRLTGGRLVAILDAASPPESAAAHQGPLAFEMSVGTQMLVGNQGPGWRFGKDWAEQARGTAAHATVDLGAAQGLPSLVSVRQAQDATGMWLLATQDGAVSSHGLVHERRLFLDARGTEARGEEILSVVDARARAIHDRAARAAGGRIGFAVRFHLHPAVEAEVQAGPQTVHLTLAGGEVWEFRAGGGVVGLEPSVWFEAGAPAPQPTWQVVVRGEVVEYLGQITWSFGRIVEAPRAGIAPRLP